MARKLRVQYPGAIYQAMNRGDHSEIVFRDSQGRDLFLRTLKEKGVGPDRIAGVIVETYQGVGPDFLPVEYAQQLRRWCDQHGVVLVF